MSDTAKHGVTGRIDAAAADKLASTLDLVRPPFGDDVPLPPLWHWLYCHARPAGSALASDGRGARDDIVPPMPGMSRMWAGGRVKWYRPLVIGAQVTRHGRLARLVEKSTHSRPLTIATVEHDWHDGTGSAITEQQDLAFRPYGLPSVKPGDRRSEPPLWQRTVTPDIVMLFRFSALTFNAHRIHYDREYTRSVELYPDLLVHGPLTLVLLLDLLQRHMPSAQPATLDYRAIRPLYFDRPLTLKGTAAANMAQLWAEDAEGFTAMRATVTLASVTDPRFPATAARRYRRRR